MAEAASDQTASISFTCPICLEKLTTAKYLPCLHTFCESCIQTYISSTVTRDSERSINFIVCPVCRRSVDEPEIDISSEKWAKCLPVNKLIQTMNINSDNSGKNFMFCERDGKEVTATYWCKTCVEAICECCRHTHDLIPILTNHKIMKLSEANQRNEPIDVDEPCRHHTGKLLEVFCEDHSELCCSVCFATEHRRCDNVKSIDDASSQLDKEEFKKITKALTDLLEYIESAVSKNTQNIHSLNTKKDSITTAMANEIEKLKTLIENAHTQWLKQFEHAHKESTDKIKMSSDELKRFSTTVRDAKELLSTVMEKGSAKQIFMSEHVLQAQVTSHFHRLNVWELTESYTQKSFDVLEQLKRVGKLHNIDVLAKAKSPIYSMSDFLNEFVGKRRFPCPKSYLKEKDLMHIDFEKLSDFRIPDDSIYFGLFLNETNILFSIESKSSLDVYDTLCSPWKCIHSEKCDNKPCGLSYGNNMNEVFVAFHTYVMKFEILHGGTQFNKLMKVELAEDIEDLVYCPGPKVVFSANSTRRCFLSSDFNVRSMSPHNRVGARAFVTSSLTSGKFVYGENNNVYIMDSEGKEISRFKLRSGMPRGMAMDSENNIFVCKYEKYVEQIKFDGTSCRKIDLSINGESVYNIVFHPAGHKFLIICRSPNVGVFQIPH